MPEQIIGVDAFTEQPVKRTWTPDKGWIKTRTWLGPQDQADTKAQEIKDLYDPDDINIEEGVPCTIIATFSSTASVSGGDDEQQAKDAAIWELDGVRMEKDLRTHPAFNLSGASDTQLENADNALKRGTAGAIAWDAALNIDDYVKLRLRGTTSYLAFYWVIRRTMTTARAADVRAAMDNIYYVFDYTQNGDGATNRLGIEDFPSTNFKRVKWAQPSVTFWDGATQTPQRVTQWLKMPPSVRSVNTKWVQVINEWWGAVGYDGCAGSLGGWSKTLYYKGQSSP